MVMTICRIAFIVDNDDTESLESSSSRKCDEKHKSDDQEYDHSETDDIGADQSNDCESEKSDKFMLYICMQCNNFIAVIFLMNL